MINLKKCPFCGGEANIVTGVYGDVAVFYVRCKDCEVSTLVHLDVRKNCSALEDAINSWNRRENDD